MPTTPNFLMIPRVPEVEDPALRHFIDRVHVLLNGLLRTGAIVQTDDSGFTVTETDSAVLSDRVFASKGQYGMFGG